MHKLIEIAQLRFFPILASTVLAVGTLLMTGGVPAHAASAGELPLWNNPNWCVTPLNNNVGSQLVLGQCAGAASQIFHSIGGNGTTTFMIQNAQSGLCITYAYPNGHVDGGYMTQGTCLNAQNQTFELEQVGAGGGYIYYLPYRVDNHGNTIALDNAGNNLVVNNHIDGSYLCTSCDSESWGLIYNQ